MHTIQQMTLPVSSAVNRIVINPINIHGNICTVAPPSGSCAATSLCRVQGVSVGGVVGVVGLSVRT